jgi:hypothetical protein
LHGCMAMRDLAHHGGTMTRQPAAQNGYARS